MGRYQLISTNDFIEIGQLNFPYWSYWPYPTILFQTRVPFQFLTVQWSRSSMMPGSPCVIMDQCWLVQGFPVDPNGAARKMVCNVDPINIYTPSIHVSSHFYQHQPDPSWYINEGSGSCWSPNSWRPSCHGIYPCFCCHKQELMPLLTLTKPHFRNNYLT